MENVILVENWKFAIVPHSDVRNGFYAKTIDELRLSGRRIFDASVPGNFELDLVREGLLDDPYYGENILKLQKLEHLHLWYFTTFSAEERENTEISLCFEGIDTASEIYLDGVLLGKTENMLIPHAFPLNELSAGEHQLVVHIIPAAVYARNFDLPLSLQAQLFNMDSLVLRKAPYMYGWDIMPRALSAGLWRPVRLVYRPKDRIAELYLSTYEVNTVSTEEKPAFAKLRLFLRVESDADLLTDFTFRIDGKCGESEFHKTGKIWGTTAFTSFKVDNAKFWMPKNYGEPNLYDVRVTLLCGDTVCDTCDMRFGIRIVELDRTSLAGEAGEFCFRINGRKIFVNGTNWVPTDAFPSQHDRYLARDLAMLDDIGCNMVRWWGGNVYPTEEFYDFCDEHGILIWQDFAMACGIYPNDARMMRLIREEATVIVRKFRNHAALALWSGDNECDETTYYRQMKVNGRKIVPTDPNDNRLTREVLAEVIRENDYARPYLPSSPYMDARVIEAGTMPSEAHLWGPRDFFKGKYYSTAPAHFASETGYHGCPSPASLAKFIPEASLNAYGDVKTCTDRSWLTHAACPDPTPGAPNSYRISLMTKQVERMFGTVPGDLTHYALASQISQAEAKKYFIERFRIAKWKKTGILWWNLVDGWPQISDAIVDHYGCKKLAYSYIKRTQAPFCMMVDEPQNDTLFLCAANDTSEPVTVSYTVRDVLADRTVLQGEVTCLPHMTQRVAHFPERKSAFYLIEWKGSVSGKNHYQASIGDRISLETYFECMKLVGFDADLEGFTL